MHTLLVDQLVGQTVGGYQVERLLGQGRLSAVYLAHHPVQNTTVALTTFILPERFSREARNRFMERFSKEAHALTALKHRHLLPVYGYGEQLGYPYLVTPYMMHGSLADTLKQQGRCTPVEVLTMLEQVASGLDYAHSKKVLHGTLKPANLLLSSDGSILVAGFGLTHILQLGGIEQSDHPYAHLLSIADTFLGPPEYMAPEIVQGQSIDIRSDIYALGIILFELLSGKPPFTGTNALEIAKQHVQQPLPSLHKTYPDIPIALELVVNHALNQSPAQRFQRASELVEAFSQVCRGVTSSMPTLFVRRPSTGESGKLLSPRRDVIPVQHDTGEVSGNEMIPSESGSWQLMPPIITSKLAMVNAPQENIAQAMSQQATGSWQILPPIVTGKLPALNPSALVKSTEPYTAVPPEPQKKIEPLPTTPKAAPAISERWSHVSLSPDVETPQQQPVKLVQPVQQSPEQIRQPQPVSVKTEVPQTQSKEPKRTEPTFKPAKRGMGRRKAVVLLATGGVVAAGALVAVNMNLAHLLHPGSSGPSATTTHTGGQTPQNGKGTTSTTGNTTHNKPQGNTGNNAANIVGSTKTAANSAAGFRNPADKQASLLVHLPNNTFAAYEQACTHEGVPVNYDLATHMFVCPAHGAIFDPAHQGRVVQGPAMTPLKQVAIHVNANGTITTA